MIPGPDPADYQQRGQLPVFIPNYYRGAFYQHPRTAGRSSQLFNTGTASWMYRCVIEELFGLKGDGDALRIQPQLPSQWSEAKVTRQFRGATFEVEIRRDKGTSKTRLTVNGERIAGVRITGIQPGKVYRVQAAIPGN
jgi:cellobionic acid phosphorylase